ncbi:MAG TPA: hypothetical protein VE978_17585 [Chitinophagales bacterium]|nr:hypothetical protein [Chitinophagales bacterium]
MRKGLLIIWLIILFAGISSLFWYNEWVYSLPTPVPKKHITRQMGEYVDISRQFQTDTAKPVFLHFFNPTCPCSKFNIPHFKSLVKKYGDRVTFAIVVMSKDSYSVEQIQNRFDLAIPVSFDTTLAISCGVYSTPQAVLLGKDRKLYYRGNYNKNRYCTDVKSNYAQMAIDSILNYKQDPIFGLSASKAYGCQLPNCNK